MPGMGENPWWHPREDDTDWDEPLPEVIELSPEYMADLPPGNAPSSLPSCWTGLPPGKRASMPTSTTTPAGGPPRRETAGPARPRNWLQTCAQN